MQVSLFTQLLRTEFLNSMAAVAQPAEYQRFTQVIPTTVRNTDFGWMTPAPGINKYEGARRFASLDSVTYEVVADEFDGGFEVPLIDIEDDNIGGYRRRMNDLVIKGYEPFRSRWTFNTIKAGSSAPCFDGSNFFATSHNLGLWGSTPPTFASGSANSLNFTAASGDGINHALYWFINDDLLKPILYVERQAPEFMTDSGSPECKVRKTVRYWIDLRAGFGYGYWWDALVVNITNTPTIPEMQSIIDGMRQVARGFQLPRSLASDPPEFVHEQKKFTSDNTTMCCSVGLEWILNHVLNEERIGISSNTFTNNIFRGFSYLITSNILNP